MLLQAVFYLFLDLILDEIGNLQNWVIFMQNLCKMAIRILVSLGLVITDKFAIESKMFRWLVVLIICLAQKERS